MAIKLCIDCKHFEDIGGRWTLEKYACNVNKKEIIDVVTGDMRYIGIVKCYENRSDQLGDCKEEGLLWEPKE